MDRPLTSVCEHFGDPGCGPLLLTCEHASRRVPAPLRTTASDRAWLGTHWGWDIGARTVCLTLARATGSSGVMARFSRLVCDPNRPPGHVEFIRTEVEGTPISFNQYLDLAEVRRRERELHAPFHDAVHEALERRLGSDRDVLLLSVHSFTPIWNHRLRAMDAGVLFVDHEPVALRLADQLRRAGLTVAMNEPYSARHGLAYSVQRHGQRHEVVYLEIELNQALICTPARARRMGSLLAKTLAGLRVRGSRR